MPTYRLDLDAYQRDNLLHALLWIAGHKQQDDGPPLSAQKLNTGDWVMECALKLGYGTDEGRPNRVCP